MTEASDGGGIATEIDGPKRSATAAPLDTPGAVVRYASNGKLLVCGEGDALTNVAKQLPPNLSATLITPKPIGAEHHAQLTALPQVALVLSTPVIEVTGYLGNFRANLAVELDPAASQSQHSAWVFDLVLDMGAVPLMPAERPAPGYFPVGDRADALAAALDELPDLVGEFEKPRYFRLDPSLCAHGRSGIAGCQNCLNVCPAEAIRSLGERIEIDPNLCHGVGSCATACPSGAIRYAHPAPADWMREVLAGAPVGDEMPLLVLMHTPTSADLAAQCADAAVAVRVQTVELDELGSVGMEVWLTLLARGCRSVWLLADGQLPESTQRVVAEQMATAQQLLEAMGYPQEQLWLVPAQDLLSAVTAIEPSSNEFRAATFALFNDKRTMLRLALDHLLEVAPRQPEETLLPAGAPFGSLKINAQACTLCLSCVGNCPARALADGGEEPRLDFIEDNCVQCGICVGACPEKALELVPRYLFGSDNRRTRRSLKVEEPFRCIGCGKAFATRSVIEKMQERLAGHSMFQGNAAKRLQMCEDCRVRDIFDDDAAMSHVRTNK
jgi:ferredoxin